MANNLLSMIQVRTIIQHLQKGSSLRRIAKGLALSRNTVKQYSQRITSCHYSLQDLQHLDDDTLSKIVYTHSKQKQKDPRREDFLQRLPYFTEQLKRTCVTRLFDAWR